ncbi:aminoglycoside phosphotransferase [Dermacoccaceae bacterium W4C1]
MPPPPDHVLDLFAVPGDTRALPGGQGHSVVAGDLVLSPGRDPEVAGRLNPVLARLAVTLDTRRGRSRRDLRIAMPVPARDGSWVVDGWGASRYEPGTRECDDLDLTRACAALLHAELSQVVDHWPPAMTPPRNRWDIAQRAAFDDHPDVPDDLSPQTRAAVDSLLGQRGSTHIGPNQLVHADVAGNVLIDAAGAPVIIDVSPFWRPALWAEAVCVLDSVMWHGADEVAMQDWANGAHREAMLRAVLFRLIADRPQDPSCYLNAWAAAGVGARA